MLITVLDGPSPRCVGRHQVTPRRQRDPLPDPNAVSLPKTYVGLKSDATYLWIRSFSPTTIPSSKITSLTDVH